MNVYSDITYPTPMGAPATHSELTYETPTPLLPLEKGLVEHLYKHVRNDLNHTISDLMVFERHHTIVGHYTEFSPDSESFVKSKNQSKESATFYVEGIPNPFGAIFYIYFNRLGCIEIHDFGTNFPPDGITRTITAITSDDPNKRDWCKGIKQ